MTASESDRPGTAGYTPASVPPTGEPSRVAWAVVLLVIALIVIAAYLGGLRPRQRQRAALADENRELAIPTVTIVSPAPGKAAAGLLLPAEVKPWAEASIHARASGYLKRWYADLGERVTTGQLLAEIEAPELDQELETARHELAKAEAALALAEATAQRSAALVGGEVISVQENDEKQADLALKAATLNAARANLRRLEDLRSFTRVTAPFDGVITARETDVGDLIAAGGAKELFRLAQTERLRVYVRVPQTHAQAVAPGQAAELLISEKPGKVFAAKVARTAGAIDADSRTLLVELEVDNARGEILAGSFAQVRFAETKGAAPLTLPGNTLLFRAEGPQVGVVRPDGRVELRVVKLGRDFGQTVEILAGVDLTDRVILTPPDSLADGATVRVGAPISSGASGRGGK
jgi:RND family efflux transporter MFP subunit